MNRRDCLMALSLPWLVPACSGVDPLPAVRAGRIVRLDKFSSRFIDARHVDVWLPPGYGESGARHAVVYMHDGQALFDGRTAMSKTGWQVDAALLQLANKQGLPLPIVVGIWNHPTLRHAEYFPQPMLDHIDPVARLALWEKVPLPARPFLGELVRDGRSRSAAYLRFMVEELKPAIDARFATRPDRDATFVMGSSMGGLISLYALLHAPQVFGAAAALSTHWVGLFERNDTVSDAALAWLRERLPAAQTAPPMRIYFDRGTAEMDASYAHAQTQVDALLRKRGWREPRAVSRVFDGAGHNERAWAERVHLPLEFLLSQQQGIGRT